MRPLSTNSETPPSLPTKHLIVIHGIGGSFAEAAMHVSELFEFESWWKQGVFYVPRRTGLVLRHLLQHPDPDPYTRAFQKLVISRFLSSCGNDPPRAADISAHRTMQFHESRLLGEFEAFGIPVSPGQRAIRARQLHTEAEAEIRPILELIRELRSLLIEEDGRHLTELEARELIETRSTLPNGEGSLVPLLQALRDMQETGGDLDTVASAAFYAYGLRERARKKNQPFVYGKDYRFVFVNYHEGFRHLAGLGPGRILAADLPIGAFASIESDAKYLEEHDILFDRYEDHHPYTPEQRAMLQRIVDAGQLGMFDLSGPIQGENLDETDLKCGADMVYLNTIQGQPWDCEGARTLRAAAHGEDFVTNRSSLGKLLTSLIKGGVSKLDLVQILVEAMKSDDAFERLDAKGYVDLSAAWDLGFGDEQEALSENAFIISVQRPDDTIADAGGDALGPGSDMPEPVLASRSAADTVRILVALAVHSDPGKPKLTTGRAIEYYARTVPDADYIFYCFGSSLMVARRMNQADLTFNLGALMPGIGTDEDGGHAGAAVCRPDANPNYPSHLIGRVRPTNFKLFVRYLAGRLTDCGYKRKGIENISARTKVKMRTSSKALTAVLLISILTGLLLVLLNARFRPAAVRESNRDFFPYIDVTPPQAETSEPEGGHP